MDKPANRFYGEQRVEIKPGDYGPVCVYGYDGEYAKIDCRMFMNADELREASHLLAQIAEYLESHK